MQAAVLPKKLPDPVSDYLAKHGCSFFRID
jgi:hypothetical protein